MARELTALKATYVPKKARQDRATRVPASSEAWEGAYIVFGNGLVHPVRPAVAKAFAAQLKLEPHLFVAEEE